MWKSPLLLECFVLGFAAVLLAAGCQRQTPRATDSKSLQKHAEEQKKQHEREMKNK